MRPALTPQMGFTNTSTLMIEEAIAILESEGVGFTRLNERFGGGFGRKQRKDVRISGFRNMSHLLMLLLPFMNSKRKQAEIVLGFIRSRQAAHPKSEYSEAEWQLSTDVRKLNGKMPGQKAIDRANMFLESVDGQKDTRHRRYYLRYVRMCSELTAELTGPAV